MTQAKKHEFLILTFVFPIAGALFTAVARLDFFLSLFVMLGVPIAYLAFRASRRVILKTLVFAIVMSLPVAFVMDYVITSDGGWFVPDSLYRFLGVVPVEDLLFSVLGTWLITLAYEYFVERGERWLIRPRMKWLAEFVVALVVVFFAAYLASSSILRIPYAFGILVSLFLLVPLVLMLVRYPRLLWKFALISVYFLPVAAFWELSMLYLGQWQYLGSHYIGWVQILSFRLPLEEFLFCWFISAGAILAWYEFFDDDRK